MNIILLSGGSGKRLWPLSNDIRSKQFIKIFKKNGKTDDVSGNGESDVNEQESVAESAEDSYESMVQRVYRQIKTVDPDATVTIATSKTQISAIHNQLGEDVAVSVEPYRRDTFPAIALATAYLHDVQGISEEEAVVVCPVDPYVEEDYFEALQGLCEQAQKGEANLVLMGIEPTYPSEKYGYIIPREAHTVSDCGRNEDIKADACDNSQSDIDEPGNEKSDARTASESKVSYVETFKEKPDVATAKSYIAQGALWNGGVFAYKLKYVLDKAHELIDFTDYADLFDKYETLDKISFDYAVVEKEPAIQVMRFAGEWKDLGTWNTLTEAMDEPTIGKSVLNETCRNVNVINELNVPVVCMGLSDVIVSASPEGILVSDREQSSYIKPIVDQITQQIMFAEKSWGSFRVIDVDEGSLTIKVTLHAGHSMNYHSHERRDEIWNVISGRGTVIVDGMEQPVVPGDVITMQAGCRHTVSAITELKLIEVQLGEEISVHDKCKYDLEA